VRFSATTKSLTSQSVAKMPILSRARSPSSLSGGSISSLSQSTGKRRGPPMKANSRNNTRQRRSTTTKKSSSTASGRKTTYKRVSEEDVDGGNDDNDDNGNDDDDDCGNEFIQSTISNTKRQKVSSGGLRDHDNEDDPIVSELKKLNDDDNPLVREMVAKHRHTCRRGCKKSCGCKKNGFKCHSGCFCNGNCDGEI